ncbi:MAG: dihydrolipoyl dehydrogenase [Spirochaetales bacterium]|nr:dihydrolipoyl dehydrogenase [Spirochaetales bacterium]
MENNSYDLIVLGGGPGGYRAAERAGAQGKKVLLIEKENLGGVCLNHGCIPTKTLLHSAKLYRHGREGAQYGVHFEEARFDLSAAMKWKARVVDTLIKGVAYQMKRFNVTVVQGVGSFVDRSTLKVGNDTYQAKKVIIATGSSPVIIPIPGADRENVVTSRQILEITKLPESLVIIGGGVIGMEFASFFSSLDIKVHVIEMLEEIVPVLDPEIAKALRKANPDIDFTLGARVEKIDDQGVHFTKDGSPGLIGGELVLMSVGRRPNTAGIGLENIGLDIGRSAIGVDEHMRTNLPGVYAVGDVTGKSLLAHCAYRMADVAIKDLMGQAARMRYNAVPSVIYTLPEAASCGLSREGAEGAGFEVRTANLPMRANGRFLAEFDREPGFCKIVVDKQSNVLLGVHMVGGNCSELIFGAAMMIEAELRVQDVKDIIFPHPTVSEIIPDTLWELGH